MQVYETFGPTHSPLYQVKFTASFPIDADQVTVAREVFHVPSRSNFVFPSALRHLKGSDASNIHDEEVAEDEIEFSDDEAELAYKRARKR
jgi:H/ACA ribonucleoprotein complex non-core subunit NAF1